LLQKVKLCSKNLLKNNPYHQKFERIRNHKKNTIKLCLIYLFFYSSISCNKNKIPMPFNINKLVNQSLNIVIVALLYCLFEYLTTLLFLIPSMFLTNFLA